MTEMQSGLTWALKEIVTALLEGDCIRYADNSGDRFYYIVRQQDHDSEVSERRAFKNLTIFPRREPDEFEEWHVRAALAEEPADRLARARKRATALGVEASFFDAAIAASSSAEPSALANVIERWMPKLVTEDKLEAVCVLLEAIRIERTRLGHLFVNHSDRATLRGALEARFLRELAERFPKVVTRAAEFDWLSFSDATLREASRCYLYGFFRSGVLVAAAALETRLKEVGSVEYLDNYSGLVDSVFGIAGTVRNDAVRCRALKDLFKLRNNTAHNGVEPSREEAEAALLLVRDTMEEIAALDRH
jgi:hypothetical protein